MNAELRDTLADLLGEVVANERKNYRNDRQELVTAHKAELDSVHAEYAEKFKALETELRERFTNLVPPAGKDGEPGKEGPPGRDGRDGLPGVQGLPGLDGKDGRDGIDGKDGAPGEKGADGVISAEALADAYKGIWSAGEYDRGQLVTLGGSLFISLEKTADKPETSEAWKLIVKRGRDGRNGKDGAKGEKGDQGPMGHYKGVA
jgi:hypothetical protein